MSKLPSSSRLKTTSRPMRRILRRDETVHSGTTRPDRHFQRNGEKRNEFPKRLQARTQPFQTTMDF